MTWRIHLRKLTRKQISGVCEQARFAAQALIVSNHTLLDKLGEELGKEPMLPPEKLAGLLNLLGQWAAATDEIAKGIDEEVKKIVGEENLERFKLN